MKQLTEYIQCYRIDNYINESIILEAFGPIDSVIKWLRDIYEPQVQLKSYKDEDECKFDGFLYMMDPQVRETTFEAYKKANKGDKCEVMAFYNKLCERMHETFMDVDYLVKTIALYVRAKSIKIFTNAKTVDIMKLSKQDRDSITYYAEFPYFCVYKYTILKNEKSLEDYIFKKWETGKLGQKDFRNFEDTQHILQVILKWCDTLLADEVHEITSASNSKKALAAYKNYSKQIYNEICEQYNEVYDKYEEFLSNLIAEQDNKEKNSEFDTNVEPEIIK